VSGGSSKEDSTESRHSIASRGHHLVLDERGGNEMYEIVEVFEIGKAQDVIKSEPKESPFVDENGQLFRSAIRDEDE